MAVAGIACTLLRAMVTTSHARRGINKTYSLPCSGRAGVGSNHRHFSVEKCSSALFSFFSIFLSFTSGVNQTCRLNQQTTPPVVKEKERMLVRGSEAALAPIQNSSFYIILYKIVLIAALIFIVKYY